MILAKHRLHPGTARPNRPPKSVLCAVLLVCSLGLAVPSAALSPHERDGFMLGVSMGFGAGQLDLFPVQGEPTVQSGWDTGSTPQMRLGYALIRNRLLVVLENRQWLIEQGILAEDKLRINVQCWTLGLNWFPGRLDDASGGFYLQAGGGLTNARLTLLEPAEENPWGEMFHEVFKQDETGSAFFAGLGYEFRILPPVAAGLAVNYVYHAVGGEIFDKAQSWPVTLTLNWYW